MFWNKAIIFYVSNQFQCIKRQRRSLLALNSGSTTFLLWSVLWALPHPNIISCWLHLNWEWKNSAISTIGLNEWGLLWSAIPDLQVVVHACDTAILMIILNVHLYYSDAYASSLCRWDNVDAICIIWIDIWVRGRGQKANRGCEGSSAASNITWWYWGSLIVKFTHTCLRVL